MNTDTVTERVITVDYSLSLQAMIAAGKYDWVNDDIMAERFPIVGTGRKTFRTKLFDFGRNVSSEDSVAAMKAENFMPGDHVHGLAYGAAFPEEQRKHPIACLGSSARVAGDRDVVCLYGGDARRSLDLRDWDDGWNDEWRFLGVQEVSGA